LIEASRTRVIAGGERSIQGWQPGAAPPPGALAMRAPLIGRVFGPARAVLKDINTLRVENQMQVGSCVAQVWTSMFEYLMRLQLGDESQGSSVALYAWLRQFAGVPLTEDSGSTNSAAAQVLSSFGMPLELDYPNDTSKWSEEPPPEIHLNASKQKLDLFYTCPNVSAIEACIQQNRPVAIGFKCFESLMSDGVTETGYVPYTPDQKVIGGHAIIIVGYDRALDGFFFLNSWGTSWGLRLPETSTRGFGFLKNDFIRNGAAHDAISGRTLVRS